jgi:hypothetical protein
MHPYPADVSFTSGGMIDLVFKPGSSGANFSNLSATYRFYNVNGPNGNTIATVTAVVAGHEFQTGFYNPLIGTKHIRVRTQVSPQQQHTSYIKL